MTARAMAAERLIQNRAFADLSTSTIDQNSATNPHADEMYSAAIQHQWLHPPTAVAWEASEWEAFSKTRDMSKTELSHIQPGFTRIAAQLRSDTWTLLDTHASLHGMTQDYTMHLKGMPPSAMSIALLIELVGQNEEGGSAEVGAAFPSATHMSKLWRNMYRIVKRSGFVRCVHGVVTDLFQIVCFRMEVDRSTYEIKVTRTAVECGAAVQQRLTDYVNATPAQLGLPLEHLRRHSIDLASGERVELAVGTRLGGGRQGEVLQVSDEPYRHCCLKIMRRPSDFERELAVLRELQGVPGVVLYEGCHVDTRVIMTSPVLKKTLQHYKGDAACLNRAWSQLVDVFQAVHERGFAYRDFRGANILVEQLDSRDGFQCKVHLTDFGTTVELDEAQLYEGTLRHGATSVLRALGRHGRCHPVACSRATELESLVKMIYVLEETMSTSLDGINPVADDSCEQLRVWWEEAEREMDKKTMTRLHLARSANYAALRTM
eukprot:gene8059-5802_t